MAEKIELTFLGTGSAIPTARRSHPAMLLKFKDENILVDCGEGTQRQFRKAKLNPCKITKILITHWHGDHVLGLQGLLQTMILNGYNRKLEIYGPQGSKEKVRQFFDLIGRVDKLEVYVKEIKEGTVFENEDFVIGSVRADHDCACLAYSFEAKEKVRLDREKLAKLKLPNGPLIGELVKGKSVEIGGKKIDGKKLVYREDARKVSFVMDTRYNEDIVNFVKGSDLLVSEATYSVEEQDIAEKHGHLSSGDAARMAKKAKVGALVVTHLSQRYDEIPKKLVGEASKIFKDVKVVEDFDEVVL